MVDYEKLKQIRNMGFIKHTGIKTVELREGYAKGEIVLDERHANPIGSTHGGVCIYIEEHDIGIAFASPATVTTVSGNINYLRPAMNCKKLIGESREIKIGKKMCVYDVMITDENDREIAKATMTYFYLDKINPEDFVK
jgi:acyl-CoA thioesterase